MGPSSSLHPNARHGARTLHHLRLHAISRALLGERILEEYPALHQFDDAVSPWIEGLLRTTFPAQTIAIMEVANDWQQAHTAMVVAECGTGKTLIVSES